MRLWHQSLIHYLPRQQLLGQHRECCALRGKGWGKKHSIVNYVFKYDLAHLYEYHLCVMHEMILRNYGIDNSWYNRLYRGKNLPLSTFLPLSTLRLSKVGTYVNTNDEIIYPEHDDNYLRQCLLNLKGKNVELINGKTIDKWLIELDLKNFK